jgi:hypothetical protein
MAGPYSSAEINAVQLVWIWFVALEEGSDERVLRFGKLLWVLAYKALSFLLS